MTSRSNPPKSLSGVADDFIAGHLAQYTDADADALRNALMRSYQAGYRSAPLSNQQIALALGINVLADADRVRIDFKAFADQQLGKGAETERG